jgi:hypothetical protein
MLDNQTSNFNDRVFVERLSSLGQSRENAPPPENFAVEESDDRASADKRLGADYKAQD